MTRRRRFLHGISEVRGADVQAAMRVLRSGRLSQGPVTRAFERALAARVGAARAVAVSNGTAGLHLSLRALGVRPGDEVLTTPFSYIASLNAILQAGARPVFVDIEEETYNLDPSKLRAAITRRSRAILLVHTFGVPCNVGRVAPLAASSGIPIIEDACEAIGASLGSRKVGTLGDAAVFSFSQNKQIAMGEGGAVVTGSKVIAELVRSMRHQGRPMPGEADGYARLGYNYKLTDLQAALGLSQLRRLTATLRKRRQIASWYFELLRDAPEIHLPRMPAPQVKPSWFAFVVRLADSFTRDDRDRVLASLRKQRVERANYFPPLHLQPAVRALFRFKPGMFPVCERVAARTLALPISSALGRREIASIATSLKASVSGLRPSQLSNRDR